MMKYNIYENDKHINTIEADEAFCEKYCEANGFTYELIPEDTPSVDNKPSRLDAIEAQVAYTAMMTDTLIV